MKFLLLPTLCVIYTTVISQPVRNSLLVDGTFGYNKQVTETSFLSSPTQILYLKTLVTSPSLQYFITNRFTVGLSYTYQLQIQQVKIGNSPDKNELDRKSVQRIGPIIHYYQPFTKSLFGKAFASFNWERQRATLNNSPVVANSKLSKIGLGIIYFPSKNVGLSANLSFVEFFDDVSTATTNSFTHQVDYSIGISYLIFLKKE